jgi:hypothetical protein
LQKRCKCGETMGVRLRTVIFSNKVEIENVPIFSCDSCNYSEIYPPVKPELTSLIGKLGHKPQKQQLFFDEMNELAHLMMSVSDKERIQEPIEAIVQERINELLDLFILAQSIGDEEWMKELQIRLQQITEHSFTT